MDWIQIMVVLFIGGLLGKLIEYVICVLRAVNCISAETVAELEQRTHHDLDGDGFVGLPQLTNPALAPHPAGSHPAVPAVPGAIVLDG